MEKRRFFILSGLLLLLPFLGFGQEASNTPLQELIQKALQQNRELENLRLGYHKTQIQKKQAWGTFIPKISVNGGYSYANLNVYDIPTPEALLGLGGTIGSLIPILPPQLGGMLEAMLGQMGPMPETLGASINDMNIWNAGINARMVLFSGLKVTYLSKALDHKMMAEQFMVSRHQGEVMKEVSDYYDKLGMIQASALVLEDGRKLLDKQRKRAEAAMANGLITKYDFQKIEIAALDLDTREVELEGNRALVLHRLHQLTGEDMATLKLMKVDLKVWVDVNGENGIGARPELAALEQVVKAREYQVKSTISGYLPKAMAFGTQQYIKIEDVATIDPLNMVGVGVTWELFDGFHTAHERQRAKIDRQIAQNQLDDARDLMGLALEKTKVDYEVNSGKIEVLQKKSEKAQLGLQIRSKEYGEGLATVNELLEALTDLQKTEMELNQAIYAQRRAGIALLEATGNLHLENIQ
ncbi:TolC family protein [Persicobacter diffluens]|uniref:TolC family protein n=1 Tax=Persicobacter diffluens TaxID=981 RepID=A0AAN5AL87_9BACT|nr:hypothetical protein PEDI_42070 [Persicobacter diffluens]